MKFDDFDRCMRVFETAHDHCVLPGIRIVARLDGRGFTRLTKEVRDFEAPFDVRFRDLMVETVRHLMQDSGFEIVYGFTESDEISLLFARDSNAFGRKERKINSVLAGEASARFSVTLGAPASFDCRVCQLPSDELVVDYFRWRQEDAHRNALNAHCYWKLRKEGRDAVEATEALRGATTADKNELLFQRGVNFNDLPTWQKRGVGVAFEDYEKDGYDPQRGVAVRVKRRRLAADLELPIGEGYAEYVRRLV